ncbi:MAG: MBL fold metallo-hydrolase [Planctomycetes bacterium]|nr:MBL fold metallo-hydrolase [Planctomycetota bacterium]
MTAPRRAAAVILRRKGAGGGIEVFLVERAPHLRYFGGCLAFPGGTVEPGDGAVPVASSSVAGGRDGAHVDRDLAACAVRELFEETGVLLASGGGAGPAPEELRAARRALATGGRGRGGSERGAEAFARLLAEHGLAADASRLAPAGRFITPRFSKVRFDAAYFLAEAPWEPEVVPGELSGGAWWSPSEALRAWRAGGKPVAPPVLTVLEALASRPLEDALAELRAMPAEFDGSGRAVLAAPGYEMLPLETPPLPPEIPTNAFLVGGRSFVLVDPAPRRDPQRGHLFEAVGRRLAAGDRLLAIVLTHHHPDHVGCLEEAARRFGAPVWAHPRTGQLLGRKLERALEDGDAVEVGGVPDGRGDWALRVLHVPGHAEDHIVLHDGEARSLIAGDLVSTLVSMYVGSPGGSLREYFASLERVAALGLETLYPSHGTPSEEPAKLIHGTLRHRRARIEEILTLLGPEPRSPLSIALEIYPEARGRLRPLVERTTRAALEHLVEQGRAERAGVDAFRRR